MAPASRTQPGPAPKRAVHTIPAAAQNATQPDPSVNTPLHVVAVSLQSS